MSVWHQMKMSSLMIPYLALFLMGQTGPPSGFFIDVPHGSFPDMTRYEMEGQLPKTGDRVSASLRLRDGDWEVTVARGRHLLVKIAFEPERLPYLNFKKALLWASGDEERIYLRIPYGQAQDECFVNEVFESVQLVLSSDQPPKAHQTRFHGCEVHHEELAITRKGDLLRFAK